MRNESSNYIYEVLDFLELPDGCGSVGSEVIRERRERVGVFPVVLLWKLRCKGHIIREAGISGGVKTMCKRHGSGEGRMETETWRMSNMDQNLRVRNNF